MAQNSRAVLYLRTATENDIALAEQRRVCTEHAAARGHQIVETFVDTAASGVSDDRPGLNALRDALRDGRASVVITEDHARLYRDLDKLEDFTRFCRAIGAEVSYSKFSVGAFVEDIFADYNAKKPASEGGRSST